MSIGVDVGITVVQVSELILSMELASLVVWGSSSYWGRCSSIGVCWGSSSIGKTSITSIGKTTIGIAIGQRGGYNLGLFSQANCQQSRQGNKNFHDVTRCVMLNGVPM